MEQEIQTFADAAKQTRADLDENTKWIGAAKKQQIMPITTVEVMTATIQEDAKRKVRVLHVRVTGWQEKGNPMEDAHSLATIMGFSELVATLAWSVGTNFRALILKFVDMEKEKAFLRKRGMLKGEKFYLDKDFTPAQVA